MMEPDDQDSVHVNSTYLAIIPLIQYITSFLCSFLTNYTNNTAGRHLSWLVGALLGCVTAAVIYLVDDETMSQYGIFFVAVIIGKMMTEMRICLNKVEFPPPPPC